MLLKGSVVLLLLSRYFFNKCWYFLQYKKVQNVNTFATSDFCFNNQQRQCCCFTQSVKSHNRRHTSSQTPLLPLPKQPREKAKELWEWLRQLEAEKFELQYKHAKQKYEVSYNERVKPIFFLSVLFFFICMSSSYTFWFPPLHSGAIQPHDGEHFKSLCLHCALTGHRAAKSSQWSPEDVSHNNQSAIILMI